MANFTPRPTIYKGIQMRSRLEAGFAAWLDRVNLQWEYEPHALANEHGQYLSDFLVRDCLTFVDDERFADVYIELKPTPSVIDWPRIQKARDICLAASGTRTPNLSERLFVLMIADRGPFLPLPTQPIEGIWSLLPLVWVHQDRQTASGAPPATAALTFAALDQPFPHEWWK